MQFVLKNTIGIGMILILSAATCGQTTFPKPQNSRGKLVHIEGNTLTIKNDSGETFEQDTDIRTKYFVDLEEATLGDLEPGMSISISPVVLQSASGNQTVLLIRAFSPGITGQVLDTQGETLVVDTTPEGFASTRTSVKCDAKTRIVFLGLNNNLGRIGELAEIKTGQRVRIGMSNQLAVLIQVIPDSLRRSVRGEFIKIDGGRIVLNVNQSMDFEPIMIQPTNRGGIVTSYAVKTMKMEPHEEYIKIGKEVPIFVNGQAADLSALQSGMQVSIEARTREEQKDDLVVRATSPR